MNIVEAEKALTRQVAAKLELNVDAEVFRGRLPEGVKEGVAVRFVSGTAANMTELNHFSAEIAGRFHNPETVQSCLSVLCGGFPVFGEDGFTSMELDGPVAFELADDESSFTMTVLVTFA